MAAAAVSREVALVDLDCFYCVRMAPPVPVLVDDR